MRPTVTFFYRKKNPSFFSLERVFGGIAAELKAAFGEEFSVEELELPLPTRLTTLTGNIRFARKRQSDINHVTGDTHYITLGFSSRKVNILTIHDCVMLNRLPRSNPRFWMIKWLWYQWPVRKADTITVISENTKAEVIRFTHCDPAKVRVIPNFVHPGFSPSASVFNAACPRILFIGTTPNKNLERLAEALEGLAVELTVVGRLTAEQKQKLTLHRIVFEELHGLSDEGLVELYRDCDIVAFPTTYEGFGLPIIEGQTTGRPVLTSRLPPMQEVAGEGACLVDPYNVTAIREGILRIIRDTAYRQRLVEAGFRNAKKYELKAVAEQYAGLYRELKSAKPCVASQGS